ncbi:hypothetical protein FQR65_LT17038 [Abscondita terminalis]|nr:hypothetical protein FQR65_LT17038 [Abscondita terminalis]
MGMIGGGKNAFIGAVHRMAAGMDGHIEFCCGALSSDPIIAQESGELLSLPQDRIYTSYQEMIAQESQLPADKRIHFVSIVTPNFAHFDPAMMALDHGFHVVLEKPMTPFTLEESSAASSQGWLSTMIETDVALAAWRTDPEKSGKSGCMGDIGTHAAHLAEYISGLKIQKICADLHTFVEGRRLEDDGNILLRFDNGASGVLSASQVAAGEENALKIRIYGEKAGLEWNQQEPNTLRCSKWLDAPAQIFRSGQSYAGCDETGSVVPNSAVPTGVDYKQWLGPASACSFYSRSLSFNFRWLGLCRRSDDRLGQVVWVDVLLIRDLYEETPDTLTTLYEFDKFQYGWDSAMAYTMVRTTGDHGIAYIRLGFSYWGRKRPLQQGSWYSLYRNNGYIDPQPKRMGSHRREKEPE